jgi:xanthine dehydrogenase YagR molybdenum-binding subunit
MTQIVGKPLNRVDGWAKVTGRARYAADQQVPDLTHGALVLSTVGKGRIRRIDTRASEAAPGVLAVFTHQNLPRFAHQAPTWGTHAQTLVPMQDDVIQHTGQQVAVVVAGTLEQAHYAAGLVEVEYDAEQPTIGLRENLGQAFTPPDGTPGATPLLRGDPAEGLADADARIDAEYSTSINHHNPIEPSATIAVWNDNALTLYESTQSISLTQQVVAQMMGVPQEHVRVIAPFLGGGFGCKGFVWPHTYLTAAVARAVRRPVKLVLTRGQQYTITGHRPASIQRLRIGAARDGRLTAITHHVISHTSPFDLIQFNPITTTQHAYGCPNVQISTEVVRVNLGTTIATRPPSGPANDTLEMALDELSYTVGMDPIQLRLRNYIAEAGTEDGPPLRHRYLRECYALGAERFGWPRRRPEPGSMRRGEVMVGWGMAGAYHMYHPGAAEARVRITPDGRAVVGSGTQDIGTGTYTIMSQIAAEALGMPVKAVRFQLGDTSLPAAPSSSGSATAVTVGVTVRAAGHAARDKVIRLAAADPHSPLYGTAPDRVGVEDGRLFVMDKRRRGETYQQVLTRHGGPVEATGSADSRGPGVSYGAVFAEVNVSTVTGEVRATRLVCAVDVGRVLNAKTARSQAIGGVIWGLGMALTEHTIVDRRFGRVLTANLASYLVPVEADVPDIDVVFVDKPDPQANPLGARGMGEVTATGAAAAIANAVYHATGHRIRDLPITPDKLLRDGLR